MHASFIVQGASSRRPTRAAAWVGTAPEWAVWEVELADIAEVAAASSADAVIVASVDDSSVCEVVGLNTGQEQWRWIFGESSDDDDALEDSLPARVRETAHRIEAWAASVGLFTERTHLISILSSGDVFAETGLFDLLRHFGIAGDDLAEGDETPESPAYEAPVIAESISPAEEEAGPTRIGMYAARLDHDRDPEAWARFVDSEALHDYGEPPAVLQAREGARVVMVSDPPVQTSGWGSAAPTVDGMTGEWLPVPESANGSIADAAAWAYQQFGPARTEPGPDRRPLRGEVNDEPPDEWREANDDSWRYEIARPRYLRAVFTLAEDIGVARDDVAAWMTDVRAHVIEGIIAGYRAGGGTVAHDAADFPPPGAIGTGCVKRLRSGRLAVSSLVGQRWNRLITDIKADRIAEVTARVQVARRYTNVPARLRWGDLEMVLRMQRDEYQGGPRIELRVSDPLMRFVGSDAVVECLRRAATLLPVTSGTIRFSRSVSFGPWVHLAPATVDTNRIRRGGLVVQAQPISNPAAELVWLQTTHEPHQLGTNLAQSLSASLGLDPVTFDR